MTDLITWGPVIDRHLLGLTPLGKVFIRLNKEDKVTGMYTMFEHVEKFVPKDETQESLESAKKTLFEIVKNKIEKDILLKKDFQL
jgi:hypothetical protein